MKKKVKKAIKIVSGSMLALAALGVAVKKTNIHWAKPQSDAHLWEFN